MKRAGQCRASALVALLLSACGVGDAPPPTEVRVSAAASLADAFAGIERAFEAAAPGVDVVLNLAGSAALREQILAGAPVDVFAPADPTHMDRIVASGATLGAPRLFARGRLQIAVPAGNPAGIAGLGDFARDELLLGLCAAEVPCGDLARRVLGAAGVTPAVDTHEPNVRALLTRIEAGELDAGLVYATDVASAKGVEGIDVSAGLGPAYPIAVLRGAPHREEAATFVRFVLSAPGREILDRHGFASP